MGQNYEKNWFEYKGQHYGYGTIVKLRPEVYKGSVSIEKRCRGIMQFTMGLSNGYMRFSAIPDEKTTIYNKVGDLANIWDPNEIIEYIVAPVYVEFQPIWKIAVENYKESTPEDRHVTFLGTFWYVTIMFVGAFFYDRLLIWAGATIVYVIYWINTYRN